MLPLPSLRLRSLRSAVLSVVRRPTLLAVLGFTLPAALGVTVAARARGVTRATFDISDTFSPADGTHFTSASQTATVSICDDSYEISTVSAWVNGSPVSFEDGLRASCGGDPGDDKGNIEATLVPGSNDVEVEICDTNSDCTFDDATYYYDVPAMTVEAAVPAITDPLTSDTTSFWVFNTAEVAGTVDWSVSCSGGVTCSGGASYSLAVDSAHKTTVTVSRSTTGAGTVTFSAHYDSWPSVGGSDTTHVMATTPVSSVFVGFDAPRVDVGQNTTAHATLVYADGSTLPNAPAAWSSGNTGIATVNASTGSVSGAGAGSIGITATVFGASGSASIPVTTPPSVGLEVSMQRLNPEGSVARDACLTIAVGDDASYECGDLRLVHPLPSVMTMNESRAPMLTYNSRHSKPIALVAANFKSYSISPTSLTATLKIGGHTLTQSYPWNSSCNGTTTCRIVIPVPADSLSLATGWYADTLQVSATSGGTPYTATDAGSVAIVNRTTSPFGAGWWLNGLEQLFAVPGDTTKMLWVAGDGSTRLYAQTGVDSVFTPQTVVDRPDTLIQSGSGNWERHLRNGAFVEFNSSGYHVRTVNRERDTTRFVYGSVLAVTLDSIVLPAPSSTKPTYTFSYAPNWESLPVLASVASPGASGTRTTSVTNSGLWQITGITDPDSTAVSFLWEGNNRIVKRTNRLGDPTIYRYDAAGGVKEVAIVMSAGDSIIHTFCSAETRTLDYCSGDGTGTMPVPLSSAVTRYDGPRTDSTDVTNFFIGRFGAPDTVVDAHSNRTRVHRSLMFPALADSVIDPTNFKREAVYTARGLLQWSMSTAPYGLANDTTRYAYDSTYDRLISVTAPTGEVSYFGYDPTTGNRIWQRTGANDSTKVIFGYNARNQLDSVLAPAHGGAQHIAYDTTLGNTSRTTTPLGYHVDITRDAIGESVTTSTPTDSAQTDTLRTVEQFTYDVMGRLRVDSTTSASFTYTTQFDTSRTVPSLARVVHDSLDAEGALISSKLYSVPAVVATLDTQTTTFTYDAAHRRRTHVQGGASRDSTWYDAAGNPIGQRTGRGKVITQVYDALNQLVQRIVPGDSVAQETCLCSRYLESAYVNFPYWPTVLPGGTTSPNVIIPPDTAAFVYDAAGHQRGALNGSARVWRSYYANGALQVETDSVHAYDPAGTLMTPWSEHVYWLDYTYDLSGRRTQRIDSFGGTQNYHYDLLGLPDSTTDTPQGVATSHHAFAWDASARLVLSATAGTGITESRRYDDDDRLIFRQNPELSDSLTYDARGNVAHVSTHSDSIPAPYGTAISRMVYDGLGALVLAEHTPMDRGPMNDEYELDALGNIVRHDRNRNSNHDGLSGHNQSFSGPHLTQISADPLSALRNGAGPIVGSLDTTVYAYDSSGNQTGATTSVSMYDSTSGGHDAFGLAWSGQTWVRNYYDGAEQLRVSQRTTYYTPADTLQLRTTFQEYAYDALGRRVAMRTQRDSSCSEGDQTAGYDCLQTMERFVWDGAQLLVELRDHGGWREGVDTLNLNGTSGGNFFGTVQYTNAPSGWGIAAPLQVQKMNVTGSGFVLHASSRGTFVAGTTVGGKNVTSYQWPARREDDCLAADTRFSPVPDSEWLGSLAAGKTDANGLIYTANGYYDPKAARFTNGNTINFLTTLCSCDGCVNEPEDTGGNDPVTPPTISSGGGGGSGGGGKPSPTPQKPETTPCPLGAPTGKYRPASGLDARFDPTTAAMLSTALANLNQQGITPVITSGFRSPALQAALRNTNSPVVITPAKVSWHEVGAAVDFGPNSNARNFPAIEAAMVQAGFVWGGNFRTPDVPHFQSQPGGTSPTAAQVRACTPGGH